MKLSRLLQKIRSYFPVFRTLFRFNDPAVHIHPCDVLFFCQDVNRGISLNNQAYSPLIDSVREDFEQRGLSCLSVAYCWSQLTGKKGYGSPISADRLFLIENLKSSVYRKIQRLSRRLGHSKEYEPEGDYDLSVRFYRKIIGQARPKLIITMCTPPELCEAARLSKVFHVELLHGIGYTCLPYGCTALEERHLPQGILSLDEVSTNTLYPLQAKGIITKTIPHPFLRRFTPENQNKLPREWKIERENNSSYEKEILVSLQWGYAGDDAPYNGILKNGLFFEELAEVIKLTKNSIFWRFRFHPFQLRQRNKYANLFSFMDNFVSNNQNCEWQQSSTLPLPSVASICSGHITMNSMSCYDVAYFGLPSLALCPSIQVGGFSENFLADLVEKHYLTKQKPSVAFILDWVKKVEKIDPLLDNLTDNTQWEDALKWLFRSDKLDFSA